MGEKPLSDGGEALLIHRVRSFITQMSRVADARAASKTTTATEQGGDNPVEVLLALVLALAAGWLIAFVMLGKSNKSRSQTQTMKRIPVIPPKNGISEITSSALESQNQRNKRDIPLIEIKEQSTDEYLEIARNKPYGKVLGLLVPETLVDGKQTWELAQEAKHDLQKTLECCRAVLEGMRAVGHFPAPFYFKRCAILFRKQKMYEQEIKIIEFYWRAIEEVSKKNKSLKAKQAEALKADFEHHYAKAKLLHQKKVENRYAPSSEVIQILRSRSSLTGEQIISLTEKEAWELIYEIDAHEKAERDANRKPTVCFTGFNKNDKAALAKAAKERGLMPVGSVSKNLDYLVLGETPGESKIAKAESVGAKLLQAHEFEQLFK